MGYWVAHRFPRFLCPILDPTNLNFNLRTMQTVFNFTNQVVLGLEPDDVVALWHRALHLSWGSVGSTRKVRVVIHRGQCPGSQPDVPSGENQPDAPESFHLGGLVGGPWSDKDWYLGCSSP